jgi:hypothetical protein
VLVCEEASDHGHLRLPDADIQMPSRHTWRCKPIGNQLAEESRSIKETRPRQDALLDSRLASQRLRNDLRCLLAPVDRFFVPVGEAKTSRA